MVTHLSAALSVVNSAALCHEISGALCNAQMRPVEDTRRERLLQLKQEFGSWAELNKRLENSARDSTLSQIANGSTGSKTQKAKAMGSPLARRLEAVCGKPSGWMDSDPADEWPFSNVARPSRDELDHLSSQQRAALEDAIRSALVLVGLGGANTPPQPASPTRLEAA